MLNNVEFLLREINEMICNIEEIKVNDKIDVEVKRECEISLMRCNIAKSNLFASQEMEEIIGIITNLLKGNNFEKKTL